MRKAGPIVPTISLIVVSLTAGLWLPAALRSQEEPPLYLEAIRTAADFDLVSRPEEGEVERATKYLVPARDDPDLLGVLFQNVNLFALHYQFLAEVFPERFPAFGAEEYLELVERRATREYFAGTLARYRTGGEVFYGFTVFTDTSDPAELPRLDEVRRVWQLLTGAFSAGELRYAPVDRAAIDSAREWEDPGFPIYLGREARSTYEAYTRAVNYGTLRVFNLQDFEQANAGGGISWQDVLVLERAPSDIEGVVAGVVTAEPQGELSHLLVRTARRGTPNCYLEEAMAAFRPLAGRLIRLEVTRDALILNDQVSLAEAEAWWREHRPRLAELPPVDRDHEALASLEEIDLTGAPASPEARYGGKASNLARLERLLTGELEPYREPGFAVPVKYYLDFMEANRTASPADPGRQVSYREYLEELFALESFRASSTFRFAALARFREEAEEHGVVPPAVVTRIALRALEVFGDSTMRLRFRSSSNIEDALEFNGAGLYDSTSACAADDLDADGWGPSRCDRGRAEERGVARALKKVWVSLWNFRAFEEREYYQIPQEAAAMAVLVTRAFPDEEANGVAFTGDPARPEDPRYVVVAQRGEESVVDPEPGVRAEKTLLEVEDGRLVSVLRARRSSLAGPGGEVLGQGTLEELARILWVIDQEFEVDLAGHRREEALFDIEFKVEPGGELAVKQVRPFLVTAPAEEAPTFVLEVPEGTVLCGHFADGRSPRVEYEVRSQLRLRAGRYDLPAGAGTFAADLIDEVLFGPAAEPAPPEGEGRFTVETSADGSGTVRYWFTFTQGFGLPGGESLAIAWRLPPFETRRGEEPDLVLVAGEEFLAREVFPLAGLPGGDADRSVRYGTCTGALMPLWHVAADLEGGGSVRIDERFDPPFQGSAPAVLEAAEVTLGGVSRRVTDYWHLVYAALHHNVNRQYWVVLEPPVVVPGTGAVKVVELSEPDEGAGREAEARYLGEDLEELARPPVAGYSRCGGDRPCGGFRRGDADASGVVVLTDPIFVLRHLFQGGRRPECPDAADFDDNGVVELTDAILILSFLFRGFDEAEPPGPYRCGLDPTADSLGECEHSGCP